MICWEHVYDKMRLYRIPVGLQLKYVAIAKYRGRLYTDEMIINQHTIDEDSIDDEGFVDEFAKERLARNIYNQIIRES